MAVPAVLDRGGAFAARSRRPWSHGELTGLLMLLPYLVIFAMFVVYPVGYGLWVARHPDSYRRLAADPIFLRSVFNTVAFLLIAINVKMVVALALSGFFIKARWWIRVLSLIFILPWA